MTTIKVGMADYKIASRPDSLMTVGLGSCVGICIYDKITGIIGMAHVMLPTVIQGKDSINVAKFAETAIPVMLEEMLAKGAKRMALIAKIAGGAQMFSVGKTSDIMQIGIKNVASTKAKLAELGIPLNAEDTGGHSGRTIEFFSLDGRILIKSVGKEPYYI